MKIISIVGARPEFIQAMPISRALLPHHNEILVHTGQHYDYQMSQTFFDELAIRPPDYNLEVGSSSHAKQIAIILIRLEEILLKENPDFVIVRGDTNSTLAGALAASQLSIPVVHIEAGERSFNRKMPEEINRVVTDCLANLHFCVSEKAINHLAAEGIHNSVYLVGDVMLDALMQILPIARRKSDILARLNVQPENYVLLTIHRATNTDSVETLKQILNTVNEIPERIIFPVHPRTRKIISTLNFQFAKNISLIEPVGYYDMLILEENARLIATDSGGVQREAYFLKKPCLTIRNETEWEATVETGWNKLVGTGSTLIKQGWVDFNIPIEHPAIFGDGHASQKIVAILEEKIPYLAASLSSK
jgi:UDP-GlcNAc3NAcA epimerase